MVGMQVTENNEFDSLKKLGVRWAILASLTNDLQHKKIMLPLDVTREIQLARVMIESGCYSTCDVTCTLDKIEGVLVMKALTLENGYVDTWFNLLEKAMRGLLTARELHQLPFINPILNGCKFLKCMCDSN